jgi:hypothetical protein
MPLLSADDAACWPTTRIEGWPQAWFDTCESLHLWTQMAGKLRLALTPKLNHWWNVPLYLSARGLTTSAIPYGARTIELEFDLLASNLELRASDGGRFALELRSIPVARFYHEFLHLLDTAGVHVRIWPMPVEIPGAERFDQDHGHDRYDPAVARTLGTILRSVEGVFQQFRTGFIGKSSPVHFFWGSFDLAVTRFSGRPAAPRPGADAVTREAYSHEVSSVGFWPGNRLGPIASPSFYAYAAPEPPGFPAARVSPPAACYNGELKEFVLDYEAVRADASPTAALLDFCQTTYAAAAELGHWDRVALERPLAPAA